MSDLEYQRFTKAFQPPKAKKPPTVKTMMRWMSDGVAKAVDGCRVEPDGTCQHGSPSWLLKLGII